MAMGQKMSSCLRHCIFLILFGNKHPLTEICVGENLSILHMGMGQNMSRLPMKLPCGRIIMQLYEPFEGHLRYTGHQGFNP